MENRKKKYFIEPKLKLVEQQNDLKMAFPESDVKIKNGMLTWWGKVKTGPFSIEYDLKIEYKMEKYPKIWLLNADVEEGKWDRIPHHYNTDEKEKIIQLCLFKPKYKEWKKQYYLSKTIIPWAIEWLYFYEIWKITGKWKGGGEHPTSKDYQKSDKYKEKVKSNR